MAHPFPRANSIADFVNPVDLAKKVRVPNRSAILTVGDALKADILLHLDDIANATIFDLPQRSCR